MSRFSPDLVCVEGNPAVNRTTPLRLSRAVRGVGERETIERYGESGFALRCAVLAKKDVISPEPEDAELMAAVLSFGYTKDEIFAYWTATLLVQWHRTPHRPDAGVYLERYYKSWAKGWGWRRYEFSLEHYANIHQRLYHQPFEANALELFTSAADPIPWPDKKYTRVNKVSAAMSRYRDEYMVARLARAYEEGKRRIFVVYGSSHAVMQQPAFRALFENFTSLPT
jgi:hypothetical protein